MMNNPKPNTVKPYLLTRKLEPDNQETPISFIDSGMIDGKLFYRRNHFSYPSLSYANYFLPINGIISTPLLLSLKDIVQLPSKTIKVVLECAGNKRSFFEPEVFGEQWGKGAISQGNWKGVPLKSLLEQAGIKDNAKEVIVEGYDFGKRTDTDQVYTYARSLPIEKALHPDTIIAYEYNNKSIPFKHGYPLRLIVPYWYAMASVKWIKQITVIDGKFKGPFQTTDYMYYPNKENDKDASPVTIINVNSTIQKPLDMEVLTTGKHIIKGIAWTGIGAIAKLEISIDGGKNWAEAQLEDSSHMKYGWVSWSFKWTVQEKGEYVILSKATDSSGRIQPTKAYWNRKGYGYHAMDKISVKVE